MALHMMVVPPVAVLVPVRVTFQLSAVTHGLLYASREIPYETVESRFHHLQSFVPALRTHHQLQRQLLEALLQQNRVSRNLED